MKQQNSFLKFQPKNIYQNHFKTILTLIPSHLIKYMITHFQAKMAERSNLKTKS